MCETVLDCECAKKLQEIPLSNNITSRIDEISNDITAQLLEGVKQTYLAIQLDESTDIAGQAQLLVYIRYCRGGEMVEDFMFCHQIQCRTTGLTYFFNILDDFFLQSELSWERCVGICTDGAASMIGKHSGAVARIREKVSNNTQTHCMIHRDVLVAKTLAQSLSKILSSCVKIVNSIKARSLQSRMFLKLCDGLVWKHSSLLLHTEIRWLS